MILQHGSCVVTGGGQGIGRAIVERLLADDNAVVVIELDEDALAWVAEHPIGHQLISVVGDALDEAVAERAADLAEERARSRAGSTTPPSSKTPLSTRTGRARCWTPSR